MLRQEPAVGYGASGRIGEEEEGKMVEEVGCDSFPTSED